MKKHTHSFISGMVLFLVALFALGACGGEDKDAGGDKDAASIAGTTWALVKAEQDGLEVDFAELMGGDVTYEFKEGGVVTNTAAGGSVDGTYTESGGVVSVTLGEGSFDMTINGTTMTSQQDSVTLYFDKQ